MDELIKKLNLKKTWRGYHPAQVEKILKDLIVQYEMKKNEIEQYQQELKQLMNDNEELNERLVMMTKEMSGLRYTGEEITRIALKEANVLIEKAKRNSDLILSEALQNLDQVNQDISYFKQEAVGFKDSVASLSEGLLQKIEQSHAYFLVRNEAEEETAIDFGEDDFPFINQHNE